MYFSVSVYQAIKYVHVKENRNACHSSLEKQNFSLSTENVNYLKYYYDLKSCKKITVKICKIILDFCENWENHGELLHSIHNSYLLPSKSTDNNKKF